MKAVLGLAALATYAFAEGDGGKPFEEKDIFPGTYEFEIMGNPMRLYLCHNEYDAEGPKSGLYWATVNLGSVKHTNEYTEIVGRDFNGPHKDGHTWTAEAAIFRLYGERTLQGYYKLVFDADAFTWQLFERYPELMDGQTGASDEELWNVYDLVKVSQSIVGNPQMHGYQCLHPQGSDIVTLPLPSVWRSQLSSENDRFFDVIQVSKDPINSCWSYDDVYGKTHLFGNIYLNTLGGEIEWDGALMLARWDDFTNPDHCYVGSMFLIALEDDLVLMSYQCENSVTGRQILLHLTDIKADMCPFEPDVFAELTTREREIHNLDK